MENLDTIHAIAYFNLLKTGSLIDEKVKTALKPFGLTHAQLNVLYILYNSFPEPVSASGIKTKILVSNPDVTRLLDRLVKRDLVYRETCPVNRRKIDIYLSDQGKEICLKAHASALESLGNFFEEKITEAEAQELRRILHKIRE